MINKQPLSKTARRLHWLMAIFILLIMTMGFYMVNSKAWGVYSWHKSFGLIALVLISLRIFYRLKLGWPEPAHQYSRNEQVASRTVHWLLLVGILALPLTGMWYSGASGHGFGVFGWTLMAENHDNAGVVVAHSETWALWGRRAHSFLGYGLAGVIALHLSGALKHHLLDRDNTLKRMLGRS